MAKEGENFVTFYCVYNENVISRHTIHHKRQFRESIDGDRLQIFPNNKAIIFMDKNDRYHVQTFDGETVFIGNGGIDEALSRIDYAQPNANIEIVEGKRRYTREEYLQHISPVVWFIVRYYDVDADRLIVAYKRRKNGRLLDNDTKIFTNDGRFANWLVNKLAAEDRPPVVRFGNEVPVTVRDKLNAVELNGEYQVEINYGTWSSLRRKAQEAVYTADE
jgi:hypothetical protein